MLKNYLKIASRNLLKNKVYSFINIIGLSTATACVLLSLLFWKNEHSFDSFHENKPNIYRIVTTMTQEKGSESQIIGGTGQVQGAAFSAAVPEIELFTRVMGGAIYNDVTANEKTFALQSLFVDDTFFDVFTFQFIEGNSTTAFGGTNSVVITESTAMKYFNRTDVTGELLRMDTDPSFQRLGGKPLVVSAVVADPPANSSIQFDALFAFDFLQLSFTDTNWLNAYLGTFLVLRPDANIAAVEQKFNRVFESLAQEQLSQSQSEYGFAPQISYSLQQLTDVHLKPLEEGGETGIVNGSSPEYSYAFLGIALFILLMAGINFVNISIANSLKRMREVGVRKVLGGGKIEIAKHFITETFLVCGIACVIALVMLFVSLPFVNEIIGKELIVSGLVSVEMGLAAALLFVAILFLTSAYPAFVLANLNPAEVLYNKQKPVQLGVFNHGLVVVQFGIGVLLLVAMLTYYFQMDYIQNKDLGYDPNQVVKVELRGNLDYEKVSDYLKTELNRQTVIQSTSVTQDGFVYKASANGKQIDALHRKIDESYLETMGIELTLGNNFSTDKFATSQDGVIVNEAFLKATGLTNPIGESIGVNETYNAHKKTIIGVVKDFHVSSLREEIQPLIMVVNDRKVGALFVKIQQKQQQKALELIEQTYKSAVPAGVFEYRFMDELNASQYQREQQMQQIINAATIISLLICCLGLFGLTHLSTRQRVKEIGVRKVLGASVSEIVQLLSIDFLKLLGVSFLIALPVAWYVLAEWLNGFAYRIDNTVQILVLSCIAALLIAFVTISYQAIKAALANPVESLRKE